jgi:hypothetical protein
MNGWRKSTHSFANGNCAEVTAWRKSSHSIANGDCAEVGQDGTVVGVRDSQDPTGPVLAFSTVAWTDFLHGVRQDTYLVPVTERYA